jgi:hypothetical protein
MFKNIKNKLINIGRYLNNMIKIKMEYWSRARFKDVFIHI